MTVLTSHTTRANGTVLTAAIYNFDHNVHIGNAQALDAAKMEGATPPVADGAFVVFDGTAGNAIRASGVTPYVQGGAPVAIADGGTGQITAAAAFGALKQVASATATGVVEHATDAEVRAATTGNLVMIASHLESAAAIVTLTDAATIALDWDTGINFIVSLTANRALGNPTNGQIGTWRTIRVLGNDATDRTLTFGANYSGVPVLTDIDSGKQYLLSIFCYGTNQFMVASKVLFP